MNPLFDWALGLPTVVVVLYLLAIWGAIAFVINRFVVPRLCGKDGERLGRFEAEVTSQIALAFGLLISFNAVWLWDRGDRVREAILEEAAALESVLDEADFSVAMSAEQRTQAYRLVGAYATHLIRDEWPRLATSSASRERPAQLIALRRFASGSHEALLDPIKRAEAARETRIRDGQMTMPRSRWGIVFALGVLTLVSIGALHGNAPRGRVLALALVTLAISFCFIVLFVNGRPFVGDHALQPTALAEVVSRAGRN